MFFSILPKYLYYNYYSIKDEEYKVWKLIRKEDKYGSFVDLGSRNKRSIRPKVIAEESVKVGAERIGITY